MYGAIEGLPYSVSSDGLFCSIVLLFLMLLLLIITIAAFKWRMNKVLGIIMLLGYAVFLTISLLVVEDVFICPVDV